MQKISSACRRLMLGVAISALAVPAAWAQAENTLAKIASSGKMVVSYRETSIPFSYLVGPNQPVGYAMDLCMAVVEAVKTKIKKPDLKVEFQLVTSQNRMPLVANGTVDIECGSTTNNTLRREQVEFSINHFYTGTKLLTKKTSGIKNYEDLKGKTLATNTGTTNLTVLRKYDREHNLNANIISGKDHAEAMLLVASDKAVAFGMDDILLYSLSAADKDPSMWAVVGDALQVEPYALMFRKNDPEFKKLVDDTMISLIKSGEYEKLYKKWFQAPIPPKNINLNVPMSEELKRNMKEPTDKPMT